MTEVVPPKRRRNRQTRKSVILAEKLARTMISIGGIGTIVAVSLILLFLLWVVVPLFGGASTGDERRIASRTADASLADFGCDDYRLMAWTLARDGRLTVFRMDTGEVLSDRAVVEGPPPTAIAVDRERHGLALGFADGSVRLGTLGASAAIEADEHMPESVRGLAPGAIGVVGDALVQRTPEGQLRVESCSVSLQEPMRTEGGAVVLLDHAETARGDEVCVLDEAGRLRLYRMTQTENLLTGEVTRQLTASDLPFTPDSARGAPMSLLIASGGSSVYVAWRDGRLVRYDTRDIDAAKQAEELDLVPEPGAELTALSFLIGRSTLIAGDSLGRLHAWFCVKPQDAGTIDGAKLVHAHELAGEGSAVTALSISMRTRTVAAGFADGRAGLYNVTSSKLLAELETDAGRPIAAIALAPKEDGLIAVGGGGLWSWSVELGHPEANFQALFRPVWYEGAEKPEHVWQSSSGTDDFEPKYGMMPLVFGTLKATLYSMLFGVPLALLAAVFSSEFLSARVRVPVKSLIEVMAGLPSVVLGFLAAIIIAPFVQHVVPQTLAAFGTIPFALLLGSRLWQLLPQKLTLRWEGAPRLACIALMVPLGIALAALIGPAVERLLFGGDVFTWLSGGGTSALGGWVFLFLPLSAFAVAVGSGRWVMPWMRRISHGWSRARCAWADLARFLATAIVVVALAWLASAVFAGVGLDARGAYVGTYVQRNAMIVGFVMGFAIIPIIYTIAEDALTSVPAHLRLASLGAGATPWQTAVRVIIPTAMSGLFSATMVGLGRAVGETMIVLMATGNTPVMNWNVFSGFRTLSANIATELPEAVRNSTHYRTLFLAAFVLFAITFAVNTGAEVVRQRFRKRAYQL